MSLIGSLEDLGLGDILQIISLSQKSGVLVLRSEDGEGRIVFLDGLVRGAVVKGGPTDLRGVLVGGGFVAEAEFDALSREAEETGVDPEALIAERTSITTERIDSLRRETVESAVMHMFRWAAGDFSFDVREEPEPEDPPLFVPTGINAQYLAMECSRLSDEGGLDSDVLPIDDEDEGGELSAHEMFGVAPDEEPDEVEPIALSEPLDGVALDESALEVVALETEGGPASSELATELVEVVAEAAVVSASAAPEPMAAAPPSPAEAPPLIAIDDDLPALEWAKQVLRERFGRIHIFQRSDQGLARIRQYLARAETPMVLLSPSIACDPLSGIADAQDFVRRLKSQSPRMTVLWLREDGAEPMADLGPADGAVARPADYQLRNPGAAGHLERLAAGLDRALAERLAGRSAEGTSGGAHVDIPPEALQRLKATTATLSEASSRGEVLPLVIRFAGETFERVAMFVVRDGEVAGMAQSGLDRAGGPDDAGLRGVRLRADSSAWLRAVLSRRGPVRAAPGDDGDRALAARLGDRAAAEAYLAPVESAGQIVALLYGDNLPAGRPIGDTSALEVVLHHAGLALDRAALERALAEAEADGTPPGRG